MHFSQIFILIYFCLLFIFRYEECVELLLKYGARIDTEARMCFPGAHSHNCEESGKWKGNAILKSINNLSN